ncbi:MAG: P-II family nitrogen regulator [Bacteroidota bacterium]
MKMVIAVINIDKMNETKQALSDIGYPSFTAYGRVFGRGKGSYDAKVMEGVREGKPEAISLLGPEPPLRPHRMIQIVCQAKNVENVIETIIDANQVSEHANGKIFVLPMTEAIRVRTLETGNAALD